MTGWIIFGSIVLVLILILVQSVRVTIIYEKELELKVKLLFITLYRIPAPPKKKKKKKPKKSEKQKQTDEAAATENVQPDSADAAENADVSGDAGDKKGSAKSDKPAKEKKKKGSFDLEMIMDYVESASPPVKRLFKKIRIRDVYLDYVVGSGDAAKTAIKYGGVCAGVYPLVKWMTTYLDTKVKEINIEADFDAEKDDIFFYGVMKLRISTALGCAIWLLFRMAKTYLKYNGKPESAHKGPPQKRKPTPKQRPARAK